MSLYEYVRGTPTGSTDPSGWIRCCVTNFTVPANRTGPKTQDGRQGSTRAQRIFEAFNMLATFSNTDVPGGGCKGDVPDCRAKCCEYRQFVRGYFERDGKVVQHQLAKGIFLDRGAFQEDGLFEAGRNWFYGHRSQPSRVTDYYDDPKDQAEGTKYKGSDGWCSL